jgi:hypothetical protein
MIILFLNVRGLVIPSRRLALARLVKVNKHDVILLQESMGEGKQLMEYLGKLLKGWECLALYANGSSRDLLMVEKIKSIY